MKSENLKQSDSKESVDSKSTNKTRPNGRRGNNNKRNNGKSRSKRDDALDKIGPNDKNPYYYAPDDGVMYTYTQLSQNCFGGTPISIGPSMKLKNYTVVRVHDNINIMSDADLSGTPNNVGINAATRKLYQELTAFTGRAASSYTATDLGILLVCLGSLLEMVSFAKRIYGTYRLYTPTNRLFAKGVVQGTGIQWQPQNLFADYKRLNTMIDQMSSLVIPACPFLVKCTEQYDEYYLDDDSDMGQLIIHMPAYYYVLDETMSPNGSVAKAVSTDFCYREDNYSLYYNTFSNVLGWINTQYTTLLGSATMAIVFADLINYASKVGSLTFLKVLPVELDYIAPVRYSHEEIMKLHNARFVGMPSTGANISSNVVTDTISQDRVFDLVSDAGTTWSSDEVTMMNNSGICEFGMLDFSDPNVVDPKVMIEATRYISTPRNFFWDGTNSKACTTSYFTGGDHIIVRMTFIEVQDDGSLVQNSIRFLRNTFGILDPLGSTSSNCNDDTAMRKMFGVLSKYQMSPMIPIWTGFATSSNLPSEFYGRSSFYRVYDRAYLNALNNRIMQYMFSVVR